MKQYALSTYDNPYNPFEDFNSWYSFDKEKGYDSCERLARIANLSDELSDTEENAEVERAIDKIIKLDFTNTYIKVSKELKEPTEEDLKDI